MKTTLALLCGGISSEDYLSRRSCQLLCTEIDTDKFDIFVLDWQLDGTVLESNINDPATLSQSHKSILHCFTDFSGDVVVNLLHGEKENCGEIQGLFELAKIPHTGNNLTSSTIGMNKSLTKLCFRTLGIPCPSEFLFQPKREEDKPLLLADFHKKALQFPLILKPAKGGSSVGIELVQNEEELLDFIESRYNGTPYLFEEFIQGNDHCVGVFSTTSRPSPILLPIARISYNGAFFDATIKHADTYQVDFPTDIKRSLAYAMQEAAIKTHNYIGFNGFSRCDFIVRGDEFFALEVNTHPGMSAFSIVPNMVKHTQLSLGAFFEEMVEDALNGV
jgi:D-alanine-D-alanine ligase